MNETAEQELNLLLEDFSCVDNLQKQTTALSGLIKKKAVHAVRENQRFQRGLSTLFAIAQNEREQESRLIALAALSRIGTVKSLQSQTKKFYLKVLQNPISNLSNLKSPDDRYYVALTLRFAPPIWAPDYIANALVYEKQAETTREVLAENLFHFSNDLSQVLQRITVVLKEFTPETKNPGDTSAIRLKNILTALRPKIVAILMEPGKDLGKHVLSLFQAAFVGVGPPETSDVYEKTAEEAIAFVHDITRTQLSIVTDPSIYAALNVPINWFPSGCWQVFARISPSVQRVIRHIQDAIILLAKQGITDSGLMEQLIKVTGSRDAAKSITSRIAEKHTEFGPDIRDWLRNIGKVRTTRRLSSMDESNELASDSVIAMLLLDSNRLEQTFAIISTDTLDEFRILEPTLAESFDIILTRTKAVIYGVKSLSSKRNLHIRGNNGEIVDYSPNIHELISGHVPGIRKVKIQRPMVERVNSGGSTDIVLKALVVAA